MASILKVDEMQGVTSAGDITITGEGGSATMQLQQGLAKAWANYTTNTSTAINGSGSFNVSSLTDNGTGDTVVVFTSAMANDDFSYYGMNNSASAGASGSQKTTSQCRQVTYNSSIALADTNEISTSVDGDLA